MKKIAVVIAFILALSMVFGAAASAAEPAYDYDTLVNWNIRIAAPEGLTCVLQGNDYGIYPYDTGSIPYVRVTVYNGYANVDEYTFLNELTSVMEGDYADLMITKYPDSVIINDIRYYEADYEYTVSGYYVQDRRIAKKVGGRTYLFYSKEVEELDLTVDNLLEDVITNSVFLDDDGEPIELEKETGTEKPETGDLQALYWQDEYEEDLREEGVTGQFVKIGDTGFEMFIPDFLYEYELPDDPAVTEILGYYADEDENCYIGIQFLETDMTFDDYEYVLDLLGIAEDIGRFIVNDVEFLRYYMTDDDVICLSTAIEDKGIMEVVFYPSSDDDFISMAEIFAVSIRPVSD